MSFSLKRFTASVATLCAGSLVLTACSSAVSEGAGDSDTIKVVASTSIWADVAEAVIDTAQADVDVEVEPIVKGNVDPDSDEAAEVGAGDLTHYDNINPRTGEVVWFDLCRPLLLHQNLGLRCPCPG